MTKYTPGPWTVFSNSPSNDDLPSVMAPNPSGSGLYYVAQCNSLEEARLIASAPDLLKACHLSVDTIESLYDHLKAKAGDIDLTYALRTINTIRGALAKAEGGTND